jgi:hypothetical protein
VREVRTPIYTRFYSRVALAGLYGAVRGNTRLGERHVTARAVIYSRLLILLIYFIVVLIIKSKTANKRIIIIIY